MKFTSFTFIIFIITIQSCTKNESLNSIGNTGIGGSMARYTIVNNFLYVVNNTNLKVFDITQANNPIYKSTIEIGFGIETIYPFKDKLFIGSTSAVYIYSLTNPSQPQPLSIAISPTILRRCDPVVAKDSFAYATLRVNATCGGHQSVLATYNVVDVTNPFEVDKQDMNEPYGLAYLNKTLYVCNGLWGFNVYDLENGSLPKFIKTITPSSNIYFYDVIPYNDQLIFWTSKGLEIYNINDQQNPEFLKAIL